MDDHSCGRVCSYLADEQQASHHSGDVNRTKSTVGALAARCLIQMPDHHNSAVGGLCHIGQPAEDRAYLIGPVHIYISSKKGLQRINDNQTGVVLPDRIFNTLICQGQRIVGIVNDQHSLQIRLGRKQPRLHRIPQTVLSRLKKSY